jgi:HEXXH motif-containing protein
VEPLDFAAFSHPDHAPAMRRTLLEQLLTRDAQARTSRFLRRAAARLDDATSGLQAILSQWAAAPASLGQALGYPLAWETFRQLALDPAWVAAMAVLHLHAAGFDGEWRARFAHAAPLRWGDRMTPPMLGLSAAMQAGELHLKATARDGSVAVVRGPAAGLAAPPAGWRHLPSARLGGRRLVVLGRWSEPVLPAAADDEYSPLENQEIVATLEQAGALLQEFAPEYLGWVMDADWAAVALRRPGDNMLTSFSTRGLPGVPFLSFPVEPLLAAELLVHETSHHYYHCAQLYGEPCNDRDTALYPSPYVNKDRPIDRILIAFHAFANIVLLYRSIVDAGPDECRDKAEAAIAQHVPILTRFSAALTRSPGLTPLGRALFEPLRDRLFA